MVSVTQFDERKRHKQRRRRLFYGAGALLVFGLLVIGVFAAVRFFGFFDRDGIIVHGNDELSREEVLQVAYADITRDWWRPILGVSNQFAWPSLVSDEALRLIPRAKSIKTEKDYGKRKLTVVVEEREPVGIWCFHREDPFYCGWFSDDGVLIAPAFRGQGSLLTVIDDYAQFRVGLGDPVMQADVVRRIIRITEELRVADIGVREVRLEDLALQELVVYTFPGPDIYFSLRFSPDGLGQALVRVAERENVAVLDYIDLRVEGRVYYQ